MISLGKFDGLHNGHRLLMEELERGRQAGLKTVVFTFHIPPDALHSNHYSVLSTNEEKEGIFERAGVDYLIECPFTDALRRMQPEEFLRLLTDRICVKRIVAGTDFRFGYQRSGSYEDLIRYADRFGYEAVVVSKKQYKGTDISSTRIRERIAAGDIREANTLLGYEYFLEGTVLHGNAIGRTIGFPTANLLPPPEKLLPPKGVYAVHVDTDAGRYVGIANIGCKPTIEGTYPVGVETCLFDFSGDLYDQRIRVSFVRYIRPEKKFDSIEALQAQMERDIEAVRRLFSGKNSHTKSSRASLDLARDSGQR